MTLFFVFDEHSDTSSQAIVREQADIIMDALRNPDKVRPEGEWIGGKIAREYVFPSSLFIFRLSNSFFPQILVKCQEDC
jgi:hypothetical protein